jgi:hypothetical protein
MRMALSPIHISMYYFPRPNVWGVNLLDRHARVVASSRVIALRRRAHIRDVESNTY